LCNDIFDVNTSLESDRHIGVPGRRRRCNVCRVIYSDTITSWLITRLT